MHHRVGPAAGSEHFFAPCPRGWEGVRAGELARLGAQDVTATEGGVAFAGDFALAYTVNLWSRIASRVLWRVAIGEYGDEDDLYALASGCDWPALFGVERRIRVNVGATRSPVTSLEFVTLRIKDAVCDRFRVATGRRPSVDKANPDVRIHAYLTERRCSLYVDTSGEALFKRGYRVDATDAPLRENLAAGLLALAGWTPDTPLLDPMCGSGTIAIEAAALGCTLAPGLGRSFAFPALAPFDAGRWQAAQERARSAFRPNPALAIFASDRDRRALEIARANARAAGIGAAIRLRQADVTALDPPAAAGIVVSNPPYGVRLEDQAALARFYPRLGDALKQRFAGWTVWLLTADLDLPRRIGLRPTRRIPLFNGALECRLLGFRIVQGTLRPATRAQHPPAAPGSSSDAGGT
ncbi:MAG: methyltransferase [Burkholderiales bacterium]|nr:methyltransferase [Burkholderiales bacterium]